MKTQNFLRLKNGGQVIIILINLIIFSYSVKAQNKIGVLVLAHGGNEKWNQTVNETVEPLKKNFEVEVAFGMADPNTMQTGINNLESRGVDKIIVVPLLISSFSPIIRQNEYLLGLRKEPAGGLTIMEPSAGNHSQTNNSLSGMNQNSSHNPAGNHTDYAQYNNMNNIGQNVESKPLNFKSKIFFAGALDDHPLVTEIIAGRIKELSRSPKNETVILVAHGPNDENDNKNWVKTMENISDQLRKEFEGEKSFRNIFCTTVRDDAPKEIYETAKENLRSLVRQASKDGKVIVIPLLLSQGGIEEGIVKRLEGLNYIWNGKTLLPDTNITKFIRLSVEKAMTE